jgi:molybdate transport system substrate-binding protein
MASMRRLLLLLLLLPSLAFAQAPLTVFAAASLTDALQEIAARYQAAGHGGIVTSFASSSDLARQIEQGAPADLFISADEQWADYLDQRGLLDKASRITLLRNDLVLVAAADNRVELAIAPHFPLAAALRGERLAVGDPDHVPAGIYAKDALRSLGVWDEVEPKLARAASVRAALLFVERGECPFGIVYLTDALADPKLRLVGRFPPNSHPPILYPAALVAGRKSAEGVAFLHYLQSPDAAAIFRRHGFEMGM